MFRRGPRGRKTTAPKPRTTTVDVDFGKPVAANEFRVYPDGRVEMLHAGIPLVPERAHVQIAYDRSKGPKVLSRASVSGARLPTHPNAVLERADRIFWVDTNSKNHAGQRVHTTATVLAQPLRRLTTHTIYGWRRAQGLEFRGNVERPEALAWCEIMERLRRNPGRLLHWKVCLVVDSDLGLLQDINAGTVPVWRDYWLPPNFDLVYASGDLGKEQPLNAMMAFCDHEATRLFKTVVRADPTGVLATELSLVGGPRMRVWNSVD